MNSRVNETNISNTVKQLKKSANASSTQKNSFLKCENQESRSKQRNHVHNTDPLLPQSIESEGESIRIILRK